MTSKFNHANKSKLDNEWRRTVMPPILTLEKLGLLSEDVVADVGCGIGYFTIPAADLISPTNKVFALDTSEEMLSEVERKISINEISNIVLVNSSEYDFKLPDESVSFVLMINILHEVDNKEMFLKEAVRILKPAGRIAVIDWEKRDTGMGPSVDHRVEKIKAKEMIVKSGMEVVKDFPIADIFYAIVTVKTTV